MSLGAEAMKYLRDIAASVCCIAKKVNPELATVTGASLPFTTGGSHTTSGLAFDRFNTSVEIQNFATSDWVLFTPAFADSMAFWIPPGGSKVFAASSAAFGGDYLLEIYDSPTGSKAVSEDFFVQITEIYQP